MTPEERQRVEALADLAFESGAVVIDPVLDLAVVPDVVLVEGIANGHEIDTPTRLRRADGREVAVYRAPRDLLGAA